MANLETLELTINGSAKSASEGIDQLVHSLSALPKVIGRSVNGLVRMNAELAKLKKYGALKLPNLDKGKGIGGIKKAATETKKALSEMYDVANNNGRGAYNPPKMDPVKEAEYQQKMAEAVQRNKEKLAYRRYMNNFYRERQRLKELGKLYEGQTKEETKQATETVTNATKAYSAATKEATASTEKMALKSELEAAKLEKTKAQIEKTKAETQKLKDKTEDLKNATVNSTEQMKKSFEGVKHSTKGLLSQVARIAKTMAIRTAIRALMKAAKEGLDNFYQYSKAIGSTYASSMDKLTSKWTQFKNQLGAAVGTALSAFLPVLTAIANAATWALNAVTALFALLTGKTTYSKAVEGTNEYAKAAGGAAKANKELLASFDELNVIQNETSGGGGGGGTNYSKLFEEAELPAWMVEWRPLIEAILGGVLGAVVLPKIFEWVKKILGLFGIGAGKNLLDVLTKLTGNDSKLPDITGNITQMGLYAAATSGVSIAIDTLKDKVIALKGALEGLSLVSTILNTLVAMIGSLVGGTIKLKVDRKEFDKFKEDFEEFKKDSFDISVSVYFDPSTTYVFRMSKDAIDKWVKSDHIKSVGIQFDPSTTYVFRMAKDAIDKWLKTDEMKTIHVGFDNLQYIFVIGQMGVISSWLAEESNKKIGISIDAIQYVLYLAKAAAIDLWANTKDVKLIDIMIEDTLDIKMVDEWVNRKDVKVIDVRVSQTGSIDVEPNKNKPKSKPNIFNKNIFTTTVEEWSEYARNNTVPQIISDFMDSVKWMIIGESKEPENKATINATDITNVTGFDSLEAEMNRDFLKSIIDSFGSEGINRIKSLFPKIPASDLIKIVNWKTFSTKEKFEFLDAIKNAFGSNEAIKAAKDSGIDIGNLVSEGMKSKDGSVKSAAEEWAKIIKTGVESKPPVITVSASSGSIAGAKAAIEGGTKGIISVVTATTSWESGKPENLKSDVEALTPNIKATVSVTEEEQNAVVQTIGAIKAVINATISAGDVSAFARKIKDALTTKIQLTMNNAKDIIATVAMVAKAQGGLVRSGDIFLANENGNSEMIGKFGSHTAVANQEQMVEAMARGVQYAQAEQNNLLREQNSLLRGILAKEGTVRLGASSALGRIAKQSIDMYSMATGV